MRIWLAVVDTPSCTELPLNWPIWGEPWSGPSLKQSYREVESCGCSGIGKSEGGEESANDLWINTSNNLLGSKSMRLVIPKQSCGPQHSFWWSKTKFHINQHCQWRSWVYVNWWGSTVLKLLPPPVIVHIDGRIKFAGRKRKSNGTEFWKHFAKHSFKFVETVNILHVCVHNECTVIIQLQPPWPRRDKNV